MKSSFLLLAGAMALSLASCSQDKTGTATTTAADGSAATTTTTTTTTSGGAPESDAAIEARAQRIADKMVADMKITDEATKTKIRTVYVSRARRMGGLRTKYATDTTGMAAATREANTATDTEFKTVFTDPAQYKTYESGRSTYDDANYADDAASASGSSSTGTNSMDNSSMSGTGSTTTDNSGAMSSGTDNSATSSSDASGAMSSSSDMATKSKAKMADGSKVKTKMDGTIKLKDADGSKAKIK